MGIQYQCYSIEFFFIQMYALHCKHKNPILALESDFIKIFSLLKPRHICSSAYHISSEQNVDKIQPQIVYFIEAFIYLYRMAYVGWHTLHTLYVLYNRSHGYVFTQLFSISRRFHWNAMSNIKDSDCDMHGKMCDIVTNVSCVYTFVVFIFLSCQSHI